MRQSTFSNKTIVRWREDVENPINQPESYGPPLVDAELRLDALSAQVVANLNTLRHPETDWMPSLIGPDGKSLLDVLVVGAGQGGIALSLIHI